MKNNLQHKQKTNPNARGLLICTMIFVVMLCFEIVPNAYAQQMCSLRGTSPFCDGECRRWEYLDEYVTSNCAVGHKARCCESRSIIKLQNVATNRCLNVHGRENKEGGLASIYSCADTRDQQWYIQPITQTSKWFQLKNLATGKCLNIHGADNVEGGVVTVYSCANTQDQQWEQTFEGSEVRIKHRVSGRCLNVHRGRHNFDGGPVTAYTCAPTPDQKWDDDYIYRSNAPIVVGG